MPYLKRHSEAIVSKFQKQFKVILVTGPRQVGKSTMLEKSFAKKYEYITFDDLNELELAERDAALFFQNHKLPVIIDEVQYIPKIFRQIKLLTDKDTKKGQFILTGSQTYSLMQNVTESLAGRICILQLQGLSLREKFSVDFSLPFIPSSSYISKRAKSIVSYKSLWKNIFRGSMPALIDKLIDWEMFYRSYIQSYIERDVRNVLKIKDLVLFKKFMTSLAAHTSELFNASSIASDIGVTIKTVQEWTAVLEASGLITFLYPYENNISKRTVKLPKMYFNDTGLVCYLVGWTNEKVAQNGAMNGQLFETFVVSEIFKSFYNAGKDTRGIYFYRDKDKKEIDIVIEENETLYPIEIKKSANPSPEMARTFGVLKKFTNRKIADGTIICLAEKAMKIAENVTALPLEFV